MIAVGKNQPLMRLGPKPRPNNKSKSPVLHQTALSYFLICVIICYLNCLNVLDICLGGCPFAREPRHGTHHDATGLINSAANPSHRCWNHISGHKLKWSRFWSRVLSDTTYQKMIWQVRTPHVFTRVCKGLWKCSYQQPRAVFQLWFSVWSPQDVQACQLGAEKGMVASAQHITSFGNHPPD